MQTEKNIQNNKNIKNTYIIIIKKRQMQHTYVQKGTHTDTHQKKETHTKKTTCIQGATTHAQQNKTHMQKICAHKR